MAKKDLRAQMDAARAATAFIGAAQEAQLADEPLAHVGKEAVSEEPPAASAPKAKRAPRQVKSAASDVTVPSGVPDFFTYGTVALPLSPVESEFPAVLPDEAADVAAAGAEKAVDAPVPPARRAARGAAVEDTLPAETSEPTNTPKPKATRSRKPRKKAEPVPEESLAEEAGSARMTAQVLVPMTAEQREHADLLAQVMKVTRAEVMRQALDEYWDNHKSDLQAAVAAYEQLIRKLMK